MESISNVLKGTQNINDKNDNENIIFSKNEYRVYHDEEYKIRLLANEGKKFDDLMTAQGIVMEINNFPLNKKMRQKYMRDIANIYQISYSLGSEEAIKKGEKLKNIIEYNLYLYKKIEFIIPCIISSIILIIIALLFNIWEYSDVLIYSTIGGLLSIIYNQKDIEIDYKVDSRILIIEGVKLIILSVLMGLIGYISIKSQLIFGEIDFNRNKYRMYLVLILCGYSQSFIPNFLNSLNISNDINYK